MNWIHQIQKLYYRLLKVGITKDLSFSEKLRTELCNQFILFAFPVAILHLTYNFLTVNKIRGHLLVALWIGILSTTLILNHYKKYLTARLFIILVSLFVIATTHALFGWEQRLDCMYLLFVLISCYTLEQKPATIAITLILLTYIGVTFSLNNFGVMYEIEIIKSGPFAYLSFAIFITITLTAKVLRENHRYNQMTIEQNKILEAQNKELERFTYIASHDLKSPLTNIMGFSDILEEDLKEGDTDMALQHLAYIQTSSKRMSYLIEDILELSKVRNGSKENRSLIDLNKIMGNILQTMTQEIQQKNANIVCEKLPSYYCNETEFSLLFHNLIQNGLKYNESPMPQINIWTEQKGTNLLIHFKDNGIGIEAQHADLIFEYFKRLHTQSEYEGTGIGLGLCKKIVEHYNGKIGVESLPNRGSTFVVELPLLK